MKQVMLMGSSRKGITAPLDGVLVRFTFCVAVCRMDSIGVSLPQINSFNAEVKFKKCIRFFCVYTSIHDFFIDWPFPFFCGWNFGVYFAEYILKEYYYNIPYKNENPR